MKPFRFLALPENCQLEILEILEIPDLFSFSLISKRSKTIAKEVKCHVESLKWELENAEIYSLILKSRRNIYLYLQFYINENQETDGLVLEHSVNFYGSLVKFSQNMENFGFSVSKTGGQSIMDQFSEHLLEIFKIQSFEFSTFIPFDIPKCSVWKFSKKFLRVYINITDYVPLDHLKVIFEELEVENLEINCHYYEPNVIYHAPLTMMKLTSCWTNFITLDSILTMKCRRVELTCEVLTPKELNTIVKSWVNGSIRNLDLFTMEVLGSTSHEAAILEGVEAVEWDKKRRPARWEDDDYTDGKDFQRLDDGLWATVDMTLRFKFCVWHPQFLN